MSYELLSQYFQLKFHKMDVHRYSFFDEAKKPGNEVGAPAPPRPGKLPAPNGIAST